MLSKAFGDPFIRAYLSERIRKWSILIEKEKEHLLSYMIFLRITPILPNWFINIASPHLGVPLETYFLGTLIGGIPPSFFHVYGGLFLQQVVSIRDVSFFNFKIAIGLILLAIMSILPVILRKRYKKQLLSLDSTSRY
jgi:uncharacterized membrane protein YdjX (TVP38/TMEM64 family)